jgi:acyl-CoA synthetase (AMP-forming)/AMP-acid ligase II
VAGLPKAALVTHERVMQASLMFSLSNVRENDVLYLYLPLYHSAGFLIGVCGSIERGNTYFINILIIIG